MNALVIAEIGAEHSSTEVAAGMTIFVVIIGAMYLIPTIVATLRRHPNVGSVAAINVLLGWTGFWWAVALARACSSITRHPPAPPPPPPPPPPPGGRGWPAGWYGDPIRPGRLRYFDGTAWTDVLSAPPPPPPVGSRQHPTGGGAEPQTAAAVGAGVRRRGRAPAGPVAHPLGYRWGDGVAQCADLVARGAGQLVAGREAHPGADLVGAKHPVEAVLDGDGAEPGGRGSCGARPLPRWPSPGLGAVEDLYVVDRSVSERDEQL